MYMFFAPNPRVFRDPICGLLRALLLDVPSASDPQELRLSLANVRVEQNDL